MKKLLVLFTCLALLLLGSVAYADRVGGNPSNIHINDGTAFLYAGGTEVHPIGNSLDISLAGYHHGVNITHLYLVLGIPNSTSLTPDISSIDGAPFASAATLAGTLDDLHPVPDVYGEVLHLKGLNSSNNFTNWAGAELAVNGIAADYFGIMIYSLTGTVLNQGKPVNDILFASSLPAGTFAIAYGKGSDGKEYCTPFTQSGLTNPPKKVPEPGTLMLLGTGLVGIAFYGRRLKQS